MRESNIRKKMHSQSGESISEVLIAALVVALGALLLVTMVIASRNMITNSEKAYNTYLNERNIFESGDLTLKDRENDWNRPTKDVTGINVLTQQKLRITISKETEKTNNVDIPESIEMETTDGTIVTEDGKAVFLSFGNAQEQE